jgi:hypothetical protein
VKLLKLIRVQQVAKTMYKNHTADRATEVRKCIWRKVSFFTTSTKKFLSKILVEKKIKYCKNLIEYYSLNT